MRLPEQTNLEIKLLEHKIRFYAMVNGIISASVFFGLLLIAYKVIKAVIE